MDFRFAYPWALYIGFGLLIIAAMWRWFFYAYPRYVYPYTYFLSKKAYTESVFSPKKIVFLVRVCAVLTLLLATARPQQADDSSQVQVEGSDIMLVLDASGSMQLFDDPNDQRSRFSVAKQEALNFIHARKNDPIGLVVFGSTAISRCPVTLDKGLLQEVLTKLQLGDVNPDGTVLAIGLGMAVNRLRRSPAASKIIILLTDGAPSEHDISPGPVLDLAKKYGIKVYTIGVGGKQGGYAQVPPFGFKKFQTPLNEQLLKTIAEETGGQSFLAENPEDIKRVYQAIDELEKTSYDTPLYARYHELFMPFLLAALFFIAVEVLIRWSWVML